MWLVADNDIILEDTIKKIYYLIENFPGYNYYALNCSLMIEKTKMIIKHKTYFEEDNVVSGKFLLRDHYNSLCAIGTHLFNGMRVRKTIENLAIHSEVYQQVLLASILTYNDNAVISSTIYYCDTRYPKHYSARTLFEVAVLSHYETMKKIDSIVSAKLFESNTIRAKSLNHIKKLSLLYVYFGDKVIIMQKEFQLIAQFDLMVSFALIILNKLLYRVNPKWLRAALSFIGHNFMNNFKDREATFLENNSNIDAASPNKYFKGDH